MQSLRQSSVCIARRAARPAVPRSPRRTYASGSPGPQTDESLGTAFYVALGAIPASMLIYSISRPAKDGEPTSITKYIQSFSTLQKDFEARNLARDQALEQAAADRHLFAHAEGQRGQRSYQLRYPEVFQQGASRNVPAGHYANLDEVTEHYRQQYHKEEERKAKVLAAKAQGEVPATS